MTLQPIPSEFPYIGGKFCFLFYQCKVPNIRVTSDTKNEGCSPPSKLKCLITPCVLLSTPSFSHSLKSSFSMSEIIRHELLKTCCLCLIININIAEFVHLSLNCDADVLGKGGGLKEL